VRSAICQLSQGVDALHQAALLHLDLKPENVLVEPGGHVVVLDFGLVHYLGHCATPLDAEPGLCGTPSHMSPEQAECGQPTAASDWYAVGGILFEALTGRLPFEGTPQIMLQARRTQPAPRPSSLGIPVPADLESLCMDLLQREPARRPDGAAIRRRLQGNA